MSFALAHPGTPEVSLLARRRVQHVALALILSVVAWLLVAALLVDIEGFDGYQAISNARYWIGLSREYSIQRGPLLTLLIAPAEWLARYFGLHPLDVRPHHLSMALVHALYFVATWRILATAMGARWSVLIAFTATLPSFLFFSYAPFLSQDLFPGALLLAMVVLAHRHVEAPTRERWLLLMLLGCVAALVKQTYGVFWIAILGAVALQSAFARTQPRLSLRTWWSLVLAAALSGLLSWVVYAITTLQAFPEAPWWLRPYLQLQWITDFFAAQVDLSTDFAWWLYLRNFPSSGILLTLLIIPALVLAWRRGPLLRLGVLVWIICFAFMHLLPFKEVRYVGFLAPLSALILIPLCERLLAARRPVRILLACLLLLDLGLAGQEAMRVFAPFYRHSELRAFLAPLDGKLVSSVVMATPVLSFGPAAPSPLAGDRYHRMYYIAAADVRILYQLDASELIRTDDLARAAPGAWVIFANGMPMRRVAWGARDSEPVAPDALQFIAQLTAATLEWDAGAGAYRLPQALIGKNLLLFSVRAGRAQLRQISDLISPQALRELQAVPDPIPQTIDVQLLEMSSVCTLAGCQHSP